MFVDRRVQQRRVPHPPAFIAGEPIHFACQNKPWFLALVFARNIRLSFTLRSESSAALTGYRASQDLRLGTLNQ
jgi:hypothetical protein